MSHKKPLNFRTSRFLGAAADPASLPAGNGPRVLLVGRSNVGKSSLLNALIGARAARVSQTPGKTRLLLAFDVDQRLTFIDLPGYGYARTSTAEKRRFSAMTEAFLNEEKRPDLVLFLLDSRHPLDGRDEQMVAWLVSSGTPFLPVLTKADKISRSAALLREREINERFQLSPATAALAVSAEKRKNIDRLRERIAAFFGLTALATD